MLMKTRSFAQIPHISGLHCIIGLDDQEDPDLFLFQPECEKSSGWEEYAEVEHEDVCSQDSSCPQECREESGEAVCYCSDGFYLTSAGECEDVDECVEDNGGCDEDCINKPGSYMCTCPPGYELGEDNHVCLDTNEVNLVSDWLIQYYTDL